jgi:Uma2 family endonuclease
MKMSTATKRRNRPQPQSLTLTDLTQRFGGMPAWRVRTVPAPGTATEKDLLRIHSQDKRLCELIDGTLVEKDVGYEESLLAGILLTFLNNFVMPRRLGLVTGEAGMVKLAPHRIRIPDVAFVARNRLRGGRVPTQAIPRLVPNLAVEVLSRGNTVREMDEKLVEYFQAGVELVWFVDLRARTVEVFTAPGESNVLRENQTLTGGAVLPGFKLKLKELFAQLDLA